MQKYLQVRSFLKDMIREEPGQSPTPFDFFIMRIWIGLVSKTTLVIAPPLNIFLGQEFIIVVNIRNNILNYLIVTKFSRGSPKKISCNTEQLLRVTYNIEWFEETNIFYANIVIFFG